VVNSQEIDQTAAGARELDRGWLALLGSVGIGVIGLSLILMTLIVNTFIPPLAVASVACAIALAIMRPRPRAAAITIGVVTLLNFAGALINVASLVSTLGNPEAGPLFVVTLTFQVINVAGIVGLFGAITRAPGRLATVTAVVAATLIALAVVTAFMAG